MTPRPTSIRIFLAEGTPEGLRIVDKSNWVGRALVGSRSQLGMALTRPEMELPSVYLLLGTNDEGAAMLYVGEADVLRKRLKQHSTGKDFWTRFVAFTSSDESLNKAVVRYLESRLIQLAKAANQWELDNGSAPPLPPLSEADRADAEWFLSEMLLIYPLLGIDAFESAADESVVAGAGRASEVLLLKQRGADGRGREVPGGFIVLKGSKARAALVNSAKGPLKALRQQLLDRGVLAAEGDHLVFMQDYRFESPSGAARVLVGGSSNGRKAWKTKADVTLKAIQDARALGDD